MTLTATPKHTEIDIRWNAAEHEAADMLTVCRATTPVADFDNCGASGGLLIEVSGNGYTLTGLRRHHPYYLMLEADYGDGEPVLSEQVAVVTSHGLNDTGIDWCADGSDNNLDCPQGDFPGQDADQINRDTLERDWTLAKVGGGDAGFDYTRICGNGEAEGEGLCPAGLNPLDIGDGDQQWACTRDNVTGLMWEIKVDDATHLRHMGHTYTWYNPDGATNGGDEGTQGGGTCTGSDCDTHGYARAVNNQSLCGAGDWRLPNIEELRSLVHYGRRDPAIDNNYLANTLSEEFWSASSDAGSSNSAWYVDFGSGMVGGSSPLIKVKSSLAVVRLVSGGD